MSMFPTELAAESNTQNVRTPKNHQKVQCSKDKRSPIFADHTGGKSQMVRNYVYVSYSISCRIQHLERQNPQKAPKGSKRYSVPQIKDHQYLQIIWGGKPNGTKLCRCFLRNQLLNPTLRTSEPPKSTKRYSVPEIKDRQYLQIVCEGKAKWYEIMSMFSTELAAESNTQNVRTNKKHQKVQCSRDKRSPIVANHMGGKSQMIRNYVYVSYGISC